MLLRTDILGDLFRTLRTRSRFRPVSTTTTFCSERKNRGRDDDDHDMLHVENYCGILSGTELDYMYCGHGSPEKRGVGFLKLLSAVRSSVHALGFSSGGSGGSNSDLIMFSALGCYHGVMRISDDAFDEAP